MIVVTEQIFNVIVSFFRPLKELIFLFVKLLLQLTLEFIDFLANFKEQF